MEEIKTASDRIAVFKIHLPGPRGSGAGIEHLVIQPSDRRKDKAKCRKSPPNGARMIGSQLDQYWMSKNHLV